MDGSSHKNVLVVNGCGYVLVVNGCGHEKLVVNTTVKILNEISGEFLAT